MPYIFSSVSFFPIPFCWSDVYSLDKFPFYYVSKYNYITGVSISVLKLERCSQLPALTGFHTITMTSYKYITIPQIIFMNYIHVCRINIIYLYILHEYGCVGWLLLPGFWNQLCFYFWTALEVACKERGNHVEELVKLASEKHHNRVGSFYLDEPSGVDSCNDKPTATERSE